MKEPSGSQTPDIDWCRVPTPTAAAVTRRAGNLSRRATELVDEMDRASGDRLDELFAEFDALEIEWHANAKRAVDSYKGAM